MQSKKDNIKIRDILQEDKDIFLSMVKCFYSSSAVAHNVDPQNYNITFDAVMHKSPFIRALIIENSGAPVGYALLSFTYSNEVGGMVVLIEELYISEECRGKGCGSELFEFLEQEYPSFKRLRLEVRRDNKRAIELYTRNGYKFLDYVQMVKDI